MNFISNVWKYKRSTMLEYEWPLWMTMLCFALLKVIWHLYICLFLLLNGLTDSWGKVTDVISQSATLSTLKVYNAMSWPEGAAIYLLYTDSRHLIIMCTACPCIVNVHWCSNSDRFHKFLWYKKYRVGTNMSVQIWITGLRYSLQHWRHSHVFSHKM